MHRVAVPAELDLPRRMRPIDGTDFEALRAARAPQPLLVRAEQFVRDHVASGLDGFVHGDLWQGNAMWEGSTLTALID